MFYDCYNRNMSPSLREQCRGKESLRRAGGSAVREAVGEASGIMQTAFVVRYFLRMKSPEILNRVKNRINI